MTFDNTIHIELKPIDALFAALAANGNYSMRDDMVRDAAFRKRVAKRRARKRMAKASKRRNAK